MEQITTKILIDASPVRIWKTFTDFSNYDEWNPLIRKVDGITHRGNQLTLHVAHSGEKTSLYRPYIIELEWGRRLVLQGRFFRFPGFVGAEHFFLIEPVKGSKSYIFTQRHVFHGSSLLVSWKNFALWLRERISAMNSNLKKRVESLQENNPTMPDCIPPSTHKKKSGIQIAP